MDVALLVIPDDCFVVVTSTVGLDIDAERTVDLQLESAVHGRKPTNVRRVMKPAPLLERQYSHCRIINFPSCLGPVVPFHTLHIKLLQSSLQPFQVLF